MRNLLPACLLAMTLMVCGEVRASEAPRVVVTIKPVHSLVAAVMQGVAAPTLLIGGGASPHTYSLKPSDARALQQADVVFWVGEGLETFLQRPLQTLPQGAHVVELADVDGVMLLPYRETGPWEPHSHGQHDHENGPEHDEDHAHQMDTHQHGAHQHGAGVGAVDMHLWLDPDNARVIVNAAVAALSARDPEHAELYRVNGARVDAQIAELDATLRTELAPLAGRPYIVFHDAYHYLENRYGLTPVGSITVSPERQPSAQRIAEIRQKVAETGAVCVFSEPQFEPAVVKTIIEGSQIRTGELDPVVGTGVAAGPDAYFTIMRNLATSLKACLSPGP
jgi:zinc transport system substrate-binding protein